MDFFHSRTYEYPNLVEIYNYLKYKYRCCEHQAGVKICPIWVRLAVLRKVPLVEFQTLFSHLKT